jgi:hypothetical protein
VSPAYLYPRNNAWDPFESTVAASEPGVSTLHVLHHTFVDLARTTFLAEAFASPTAMTGRVSTRHDGAMLRRMRRCVQDPALMYSILAYGSTFLCWMKGTMSEPSQPLEYFDKALAALRLRLSQPSAGQPDTWILLSVYSLAITEFWNGVSATLAWCPSRAVHGQAAAEQVRCSNPGSPDAPQGAAEPCPRDGRMSSC